MTRRRYAEGTTVSREKSQEAISRLLRSHDVQGVQWGENFHEGFVQLQFLWERDEQQYLTKVKLKVPTEEEIEAKACHATTGAFLPTKYEKLIKDTGKREFRVLHMFLKMFFEVIDSETILGPNGEPIRPEEIFLPFLVGNDGKTVLEVTADRLPKLLSGSAKNLLPGRTE